MKWSRIELLSAKPQDKINISEWAENKRILSDAAIKGPYRTSMVPFLVPVMDAFLLPHVETLVLCKPAQVGGTDAILNVLGYYVDQDPSSVMLVLADEDTAVEEMSRNRVKPMFENSMHLKHLPDRDKWTKREIGFINGARVTFGWASSVARLASRPFRIVLCDEIDKAGYSVTNSEGDAIGLAKERTNTFANRKIGLLSTPTIDTGKITKELEDCDIIYDWHVPCPYCGQFQPLRWSLKYSSGCIDGYFRDENGELKKVGMVIWEGGRDATSNQIKDAKYQCGNCENLWDTIQKNQAVQKGKMVGRWEIDHLPNKVGFHINRIYSLFPGGRIDVLVSDWVNSVNSGDLKKTQGFVNSSLAEPWKHVTVETTTHSILGARVDLAPNTVPDNTVALTCGIDNQLYGKWYVVRAWAADFTSWLIDYGFLATWEEVETLLFETTYPSVSNNKSFTIWRTAVDIGGGASHESGVSMTEEVYWWVRKQRGRGCYIWPIKGSSTPMTTRIKAGSPLEKTPSGKPIPGGLQIISLDTGKFKDVFHYRLSKALDGDGEPQAAYLHAEVNDGYAKQINAEEKQIDRKGNEKWLHVRGENHLFDAEIYSMALVDPEWPTGGLQLYREPKKSIQKKKKRTPNPYTGGNNPFTNGACSFTVGVR